MLLFRAKDTGGAPPAPPAPDLDVATIEARIGWRGNGLSYLDYDGTTGWTSDGSGPSTAADSLTTTTSTSFGNTHSLILDCQYAVDSGIDYALTGTFVSGRTYRFRVAMSGDPGWDVTLRLGNATDYDTAAHTVSNGWTWYTVDWTPSADRTDASASIQCAMLAGATVGVDHPEVYETTDEVTLDALTVRRGSRYDGVSERAGAIDFSILDGDETLASDLGGLVVTGAEVFIRAVRNGTLRPVAYGIIDTITPDPNTRRLACRATDGLGLLEGYSVERPFASDKAAHTVRSEVLTAEALTSDDLDLATDSIEASPIIDGSDASTKVLDYLDDINQQTGTVHLCKPTVSASHPWLYTTISRATLTNDDPGTTIDDTFQRISDIELRDETLVDRQRVSWNGFEHHPTGTVVEATEDLPYWVYASDEYGSTVRPDQEPVFLLRQNRAKSPKWVDGKFIPWKKRPVRRWRKRIGSRWLDSVVPFDLASGASKDIALDFLHPMQDMAVTVTSDNSLTTASLTREPARLVITLTASGADKVTGLRVTAMPHIALDDTEETVGSGTHEGFAISGDMLQSKGAAAGLGGYIVWRYGASKLRPAVVDQHYQDRQLRLDVGSHITLTADRWHISASRCVVRSIEHRIGRGGYEWETTYGIEELPSGGDWVTLDGNAAQGLDSNAVLAY